MSSIVEHIHDLIEEHGSWENYLKAKNISSKEGPSEYLRLQLEVKKDEFVPDSIVQTISSRFIERAKVGWNKYGTNLDRKDLSTTEWIQHLQDELHDAYVYSEKLKQDEIKRNRLLELALKGMSIDFLDEDYGEQTEFQKLKLWYDEQKQKKETPNQNKRSVDEIY